MDILELIKLLIPLFAIQIGLMIYVLLDLRKNGVRNLNKLLWIIIIIAVSGIGPIVFLIFGRGDGYHVED